MTAWVFPFLTWNTAPLLWLCFAPPDTTPKRWEIHLRVHIPRELPLERLFLRHRPGWDTLTLPEASRYRLEIQVLAGKYLQEVWTLDTVVEGFGSSGGASDPLPWTETGPRCPPEATPFLRLQVHPPQETRLVLRHVWGDTLMTQILPPFQDTLWPLPPGSEGVVVEVHPRRGRTGRIWLTPGGGIYDLLHRDEAETLLRLFFGEDVARRFFLLSPPRRRVMWDSLFTTLDPNPATPENEFEDTLRQRLDFAYRHFREGQRRGIQTDRGKIYVRYGPPAEVEERQDPITRHRLVLWYYPEEGLVAVFEETAWGEYILVDIRPL